MFGLPDIPGNPNIVFCYERSIARSRGAGVVDKGEKNETYLVHLSGLSDTTAQIIFGARIPEGASVRAPG